MKDKKITPSVKALFAEVKTLKNRGFWSDHIEIDEILITANYCPGCHFSLTYQGWSNMTEYRAFGICERCGFAKLFWTETSQMSGFKKKVCSMSAK